MKKLIILSLFIFSLASCTKDLNEAATNNNSPEDVTIAEVFPAAQQFIAYTVGNQYQIYGGIWAQYWTQGSTASQYEKNERYTVVNTDQDRPWSQLYAGALNDLKNVKSKALLEKDSQMYAMALVLEAYSFQLLTDAYEKVPYSKALDVNNVVNPNYDEPTVIYDGLETKLVEAQTILKRASSNKSYSFDLFYGGDKTHWLELTNTLLLKVYMRQSFARPAVASAGITKNLTGAAFLTTQSDNALVHYIDATNQKNPLHASQKTLANFENLKASNTSLNSYKANTDLRMESVYNAAEATGQFNGFNQGAGRLASASTVNRNFSNIGDKVGGANGANAPVVLMSCWESYFLQAEAAAKGWLAGSATTLYENGIKASFAYYDLAATDATAIIAAYPLSGSPDDMAGTIVFQKWVAMNGVQNFEAYTELRRYNYTLPNITFPVSAVSVYGAGVYPFRFPIPNSEVSTNSNVPTTKQIFEKMWFTK